MPTKLEGRSVPVSQNAGREYSKNRIIQMFQKIGEKTPYSISERPDHTVHVAMTGTYPIVDDFTQEQITLPLARGESALLIQTAPDTYDVDGLGSLQIYLNKCTWTSKSGNTVFTADIPSPDRKNGICTGMAYLAVSMKSTGGI